MLILFSLMQLSIKKVVRDAAEIFSFMLLVYVAAFSYHNGWDSYNYKSMFTFIEKYGWSGVSTFFNVGVEGGFLTIIYLVTLFSEEYQIFIILFSILGNVILFKAIKQMGFKFSYFALFYFPTFFLKFQISTLRQGFAVIIIMYSYLYIIERRLLPFLTLVSVAMLFHYSAAIMIPFYFFNKLKINKSKAIILAMGSIPAFFITAKVTVFIQKILVMSFSNNPFISKMILYFLKSTKNGFPPILIYSLFMYIFFVLFVYRKEDVRSKFTLNLYTFLIIVQFYLKMFPALLLVRLEYYFIISQVFLFVLYIGRLVKKADVYLYTCSVIIIPFFTFALTLRNSYERQVYMPYSSYLEEVLYGSPPRSQKKVKELSRNYSK